MDLQVWSLPHLPRTPFVPHPQSLSALLLPLKTPLWVTALLIKLVWNRVPFSTCLSHLSVTPVCDTYGIFPKIYLTCYGPVLSNMALVTNDFTNNILYSNPHGALLPEASSHFCPCTFVPTGPCETAQTGKGSKGSWK